MKMGKTGIEKWAATVDAYKDGTNGAPDYRVNPRATPAVGDLDGDGKIVTASYVGTGKGLSFFVDVDGSSGGKPIDECLEDNNGGSAGGVQCPDVK
jgi:hypothetical protein